MPGASGTSSGRRQSAIIVPVPAAEDLVGSWRAEHDPVATVGVPAHITLIVPWLPPDEISQDDLDELAEVLAAFAAFDFDLDAVGWFGRRVLWLAPNPAEPFRTLTAALVERFATPPWEDEFDEVIPHLTVAHASDGSELSKVADALVPGLPLRCRAEEIWVMSGDGQRWRRRARYDLTAP